LLFPAGAGPGEARELTRIGGTVYFSGATTAEGQELWKTDGTAAGTAMIKDILTGTAGSSPAELTAVGSRLFFVANGGPGDRNGELWKSDGTADSTVLVKDVRPGSDSSQIEHPTPAGGRLFFTADDGTSGREPWVSDGTAAGTFLVKNIAAGAGSSIFSVGTPGPDITAALGSTFVFVADDGLTGQELWVSDGTEAGTYRLKDIRPGARGSEPRSLTVAGDRLFFSADDGTHGRELWVSDGTEAGTRMVEDLLPGAGSSLPRELAAIGEVVAFSATDGVHGVEPWASNGSWVLSLGDLAPGALPSSPVRFTLAGDLVYFGANDGTSGTELWTIPRSALTGPLDFYTVSPCRLIDTRGSAPLLANQPRAFTIAGSCGIPAAAKAVAVNLTAVSPTGPGYLIAWPTGTPRPGTSNLNYSPGLNRSNNGLVQIDDEGRINVVGMTFGLDGQMHLVVDVMGYFR
jgi:ELWxxDGT repeat protein